MDIKTALAPLKTLSCSPRGILQFLTLNSISRNEIWNVLKWMKNQKSSYKVTNVKNRLRKFISCLYVIRILKIMCQWMLYCDTIFPKC